MKKLAKMALNVLPDAMLVAGIVAIVSSVHEMCRRWHCCSAEFLLSASPSCCRCKVVPK